MARDQKPRLLEHAIIRPDMPALKAGTGDGIGMERVAIEPLALIPKPDMAAKPKKRLKLWEIEPHLLCSIIGTCLTPVDLAAITRRHRLRFEPGTREHHLHSYFVERAAENAPIGRSLNKRLDEAFTGTIRLVGKETDEAALEALWNDLCGKGQIAGAYWAFMSHTHVAIPLRRHIFGDVHMLSHFMGGHHRQNAKMLWQTKHREDLLAAKLAKAQAHAKETMEVKDQRIAALERALDQVRRQRPAADRSALRNLEKAPSRLANDLRRRERRLAAARARIASLEQETERLRGLLEALAMVEPPSPSPSSSPGALPATTGASPVPDGMDLSGRHLLYVGGRCRLVPHLKARAEASSASLIHHDGGQDETLKTLKGLVEHADMVFCPIDCVSHQACLQAKDLCRRQAKPFVPLRSSSASCFARAIEALNVHARS